ncbi:hypothetical protein CRU94_04450 [Arcobacter sp. AHV-9/2010]|nr:hypothetical protein CRU94_04450 [Arcobacter sp. CECT 9299]
MSGNSDTFRFKYYYIPFSFLEIVYIDEEIAIKTIKIREENKIKLPDAIICATALYKKAKLITNYEKLSFLYDKMIEQKSL